MARGLSGYIDALIDHRMEKTLQSIMEFRVSFLGKHPDIFSFFVVLTITALLAYGVKESTVLNNIFTGVNLMVIVVVLISVGTKVNPDNWNIKPEDIPEGVKGGVGGFMPYGVAGVMAGAAKCFYGYVGFDCIATTGEEARNPSRNIPLAIIFSLLIIFLSYFGVATVLTMALPYYNQDPKAPFPNLFDWLGWQEIKWIVSIGAIFSLCTNSLGAMFPLPRVLYAMSSDGILFKKLRKVHPVTKTPILATVISGIVSGTMALLFDLHQLIDMMSIGTLLAYTIVALSVLVLRYDENTNFRTSVPIQDKSVIVKQLFNLNIAKTPNALSSKIVKISLLLYGKAASASVCRYVTYAFLIRFSSGHVHRQCHTGQRSGLSLGPVSVEPDDPHHPGHGNSDSVPGHRLPTHGRDQDHFQSAAGSICPDAEHPGQHLPHVPAGRQHVDQFLPVAVGWICDLFHLRDPTFGAGLGQSNAVGKPT